MIRGIVCCALGVLTFGIGLESFWKLHKEKKEDIIDVTPTCPDKVEPVRDEANGEVK